MKIDFSRRITRRLDFHDKRYVNQVLDEEQRAKIIEKLSAERSSLYWTRIVLWATIWIFYGLSIFVKPKLPDDIWFAITALLLILFFYMEVSFKRTESEIRTLKLFNHLKEAQQTKSDDTA